MKALPDCPRRGCDAANTLVPIRPEARGIVVAECSCCNAIVRVNVDGEIVHQEPVTDIRGNVMYDP